MKSTVHAVVSVAGAAALWGLTSSWPAAACSCLSGFFLDMDHVPDYLAVDRPQRSLTDFYAFWRGFKEPRLYLWLHAWEAIPLLGLAALAGIAPALTGGLAFGYLHHLIADQAGNGVRPGGYFLSWRILKGFKTRDILKSWREKAEI